MIEKPYGPVAIWGGVPNFSVMDAEPLHRPDLFLVRLAKGTSGKQKSWSWAILCWRPAKHQQRNSPGWQLVGKCTSLGVAHSSASGRFKWRIYGDPRGHRPFGDDARGEVYDETDARHDMVHMARRMFP